MPQQVLQKKYFTYVGGLNTEAGPFTFPPNTWKDAINVVPDIDGSIRKRVKLDFEDQNEASAVTDDFTTEQNGAYLSEIWHNVGGVGGKTFVVVQRGRIIRFYDNNSDPVSATEQTYQIDLSTYKVPGNTNTIGTNPIQIASANGQLLITSTDTYPLLVTYDIDGDTISVETIDVMIRDFEGLDDDLEVDQRLTTITNAHFYNLANQGWLTDIANYSSVYHTATGYYPSNAQIWTAGKDATDTFDGALLDKQYFGTSQAPQGHYLLNAFNRDRNKPAITLLGFTVEAELTRPRSVAFFAGRAWFAGVESTKIANWVFFSQVAETEDKFGKCYQDADPTSEFISDLVASDGGVIPIQDAGNIIKLAQLGSSMVVFADNGVWEIYGTANGFGADSYSVTKVSNFGIVSPKSVVEVNNTLMFWSDNGVYILSTAAGAHQSLTGGNVHIEPMTDLTIATLYTAIPPNSKLHSSGIFDEEAKVVYWGFSSVDRGATNYRFRKDRLLCFDVRLKAWYVLGISALVALSPYFTDLFLTNGQGPTSSTTIIVDDDGNPVVTQPALSITEYPGYQMQPGGLAYNSTKDRIMNFADNDDDPTIWPLFVEINPSTRAITAEYLYATESLAIYTPVIYHATDNAYYFTATVGGGGSTLHQYKFDGTALTRTWKVTANVDSPTLMSSGALWWVEGNSSGTHIYLMNRTTGALTTTYDLGRLMSWRAATDATTIYFTSNTAGQTKKLFKVDLTDGTVTTLYTSASTLTRVVYDSARNAIWVATGDTATYYKFDIATAALTAVTFTLPWGAGFAEGLTVIDTNCDTFWAAREHASFVHLVGVKLSTLTVVAHYTSTSGLRLSSAMLTNVGSRPGIFGGDKDAGDQGSLYQVGDGLSCPTGATVVGTLSYAQGRHKTLKLFTTVPGNATTNVTMSDFQNLLDAPNKYREWYASDSVGTTFDAYLLTGYEVAGEGDKRMNALYVTTNMYRTESGTDSSNVALNTSSSMLSSRWDWSDDTINGKWSQPYEIYRHLRPYTTTANQDTWADGYPVVTAKNKVRGRGRSIHLLFQADVDKDMWLVGWAATYLVNGNV